MRLIKFFDRFFKNLQMRVKSTKNPPGGAHILNQQYQWKSLFQYSCSLKKTETLKHCTDFTWFTKSAVQYYISYFKEALFTWKLLVVSDNWLVSETKGSQFELGL